jgi:hypothetical protein
MSFKSGVTHENIVPSDKAQAIAAMDTLKASFPDLFEIKGKAGFIAPHFCEYKPVKFGLLGSYTGLTKAITSYTATDSAGGKYRHFMGLCECGKKKLAAEKVL